MIELLGWGMIILGIALGILVVTIVIGDDND